MKTIQYATFSIVALGCAVWFSGCGKDSDPEPSGQGSGDGPIIPTAKVDAPGSKWVGSTSEYEVVFLEDASENPEGTLDYPRLFVRSTARPYTGSIARVYLSGAPEFTGNYANGFLEGLARHWNSDGSLDSSARVKRGKIVEVHDLGDVEAVPPAQVERKQGESIVPSQPIFVGDNDILANWTTTKSEEGVEYLLDKRTGQKVTGGLQVHDENGGISYYSEYQDGILHGRNDNWHHNGVKSIESNYANGLKNGVEVWRDESGLKTWEAHYLNGKQHGLETSWDENGTIIFQRSFQNGELVPPSE